MAAQNPEKFVKNFAAVVRARRVRNDVSQKKLAELARVGRTGVVTLEQGKRVPTLYVAKALANALGCGLAELVHEAEQPKPPGSGKHA